MADTITVTLAGGASRTLTVGADYELEYRLPSDSRRDYTALLGLSGLAGRGRLRFDGAPGAGAQLIDPRWISGIAEVPRDRQARHVTPVPRQAAVAPSGPAPQLRRLAIDAAGRALAAATAAERARCHGTMYGYLKALELLTAAGQAGPGTAPPGGTYEPPQHLAELTRFAGGPAAAAALGFAAAEDSPGGGGGS